MKIFRRTNDPGDINKDYRADYGLVGDAKLTLEALVAEVKAQSKGLGNRTNGDTAKQVQAVKAEYIKEWMPHFTSSETPINPYRVIWDLMHTVDRKNTVITAMRPVVAGVVKTKQKLPRNGNWAVVTTYKSGVWSTVIKVTGVKKKKKKAPLHADFAKTVSRSR